MTAPIATSGTLTWVMRFTTPTFRNAGILMTWLNTSRRMEIFLSSETLTEGEGQCSSRAPKIHCKGAYKWNEDPCSGYWWGSYPVIWCSPPQTGFGNLSSGEDPTPRGFRCKGYLDLWTPRCWKVQTGSTRGEESVPQVSKQMVWRLYWTKGHFDRRFWQKGDCLSHYLKIWADRYGCTGEVKGAQVSLCHERFFITSTTTPRISFGEDEILLEAILRRFKIIHMVDKTLGLWGNQIVDPVQPELERRWGTHEYPTQDN